MAVLGGWVFLMSEVPLYPGAAGQPVRALARVGARRVCAYPQGHSLTHTHSLSLSLSHTHTHTLTHSHTHSQSHTLTLTHTHSHSLSLTLTHSLSARWCGGWRGRWRSRRNAPARWRLRYLPNRVFPTLARVCPTRAAVQNLQRVGTPEY